jgi:hypothetical protein
MAVKCCEALSERFRQVGHCRVVYLLLRLTMKLLLILGFLISCLMFPANANALGNTSTTIFTQPVFDTSFTQPSERFIQVANRTGSHRVGGSGRSGKGGHYVGGRR